MNTDISQSSVATRLGCGGVFVHDFVTNFLVSLTVKDFWKSANIWWSYGQELGVLFFWLTVYIAPKSKIESRAHDSRHERHDAEEPAANTVISSMHSVPNGDSHWLSAVCVRVARQTRETSNDVAELLIQTANSDTPIRSITDRPTVGRAAVAAAAEATLVVTSLMHAEI